MPTTAEMKQFQLNLKRTNLGVRLGRALFSKGNTSLSPRAIADALRLLGLNLPKEAVIAVDVAQVIVAGAALYEAYNDYETIEDIYDVTDAGIGTIRAVLDLASDCGWIDEKNQTVQMIKVGTAVAQIVSSGGFDASAYVSLALQFTMMEQWNTQKAAQIAHSVVSNSYRAIIAPEAVAAAQVVKAYQESKDLPDGDPNKLSMFGFVGRMAEAAPDLFPQYFPEFKTFMPVVTRSITATASSTTWYGSSSEHTAGVTWQALAKMDRDTIRHFVFYGLVYPYVFPFLTAEKAYLNQGKPSLFTLGLMSALNPKMQVVPPKQDMSIFLDSLNMSPHDFGETVVEDYLKTVTDPDQGLHVQAGVKISGVDQFTNGELKNRDSRRRVFLEKDQIANASLRGDIRTLRKYQEVSNAIRKAFTFPPITPDAALGAWNEATLTQDRGGQSTLLVSGPGSGWRVIKNYFASLAMLDTLKRDPFFKGWNSNGQFGDWLVQEFYFMKDVETFEREHRKLVLKQVLRAVNRLSLENIAHFFGTTSDNLKKNEKVAGSPATFERIK